jgi:hypothetical protein
MDLAARRAVAIGDRDCGLGAILRDVDLGQAQDALKQNQDRQCDENAPDDGNP